MCMPNDGTALDEGFCSHGTDALLCFVRCPAMAGFRLFEPLCRSVRRLERTR